MSKELETKLLKYFPWVIVSAVLQSIALTSFSVPGQIYAAGVNGLARLISDILLDKFNINISYIVFFLITNLILCVIVYKYIGKLFTILSVSQIIMVSIFASIFTPLITLDDKILFAIFGGIVNGVGVGLALTHNASSGGTDFLSIYLSNKKKRSMWNIVFGLNCLIIVIAGLLFGWERAMYSIIYQFCTTQIINRMHKRYTSQTITIITEHPDEVSKEIFSTVRHGITRIEATGAYKNTKETMLYTVVNGYQVDDIVKSISRADPKAFINITDTKQVVGNYYQKPLD